MTGTYRAGSAVADYSLDISAFRRSMAELRTSYRELETLRQSLKPPAFPTTQGTSTTAAQQQARALQQSSRAADQAFRSFQQVEREQQRLADSEIRAARATGDYGRALALVDEHLRRASADTVRYNDLVTRRAQIEAQEARNGGLGQTLSGLNQAAGALGFGLGLQQVGQFTTEAIKSDLALRQAENTTRALAGTTTRYNEVLALARENQRLFGGSLTENITNLQGFEVVAKRTGASIANLNDISKRLAILSPEQGAAGASIALNEAFSGNTASLVRRFEIPREALKGLEDESLSANDKLKLLSKYLDSVGVTSAAVGGSVDAVTRAYRGLGQELDTTRNTASRLVSEGLAPAATGLGRLIGLVNANPQAIAELKALLSGKPSITQSDVDTEAAAIARRRAQSEAQTEIARVAAQAHDTALNRGGDALSSLINIPAANQASQAAIAALTPFQDKIAQILATGGPAADTLRGLFDQMATGAIPTTDLGYRLNLLTMAQQQLAPSADAAREAQIRQAQATASLTTEFGTNLTKASEATQETNRLKEAQTFIAELGGKVAQGLLTSGDAASALAGRYRLATIEAQQLIDAQARIASQALAQKGLEDQRAGERSGGAVKTADEQRAYATQARAAAAYQRQIAAAQRDLAYQSTNTAGKIAILNRELRNQNLAPLERLRKQQELVALQQQQASLGGKRLNQQATLNDKLANSEEDLQNRIATIQREALEKQLDAQEQYNRDRQRSNEDYAISAARSAEDEQRKERRLLAEGKILQARQAREEFDRQQQRASEDQARKNQRAQQDFADARRRDQREAAEQIADAQGRTETRQERLTTQGQRRGLVGGQASAGGLPVTPQVVQPVVPVAVSAAQQPRQTVPITFSATVVLDGQAVGHLVAPTVIAEVDEQLSLQLQVQAAAPAPNLAQPASRTIQ